MFVTQSLDHYGSETVFFAVCLWRKPCYFTEEGGHNKNRTE